MIKRDLIRHGDFIIEAACVFVIRVESHVKIKQAVVSAGIGVKEYIIFALCIIKEYFAVIHIKPLLQFAVNIRYKLRIYRVPAVKLSGDGKLKIFACQFFRNNQFFIKPGVCIIFSAPAVIFFKALKALINNGQFVTDFIFARLI